MLVPVCLATLIIFLLSKGVLTVNPELHCSPPDYNIPGKPTANAELLQVQIVIRHGDRLPIIACWPNDNIDRKCNLTVTSIPDTTTTTNSNVNRLFRHKFLRGRNVLEGDCDLGQLTLKGYDLQVQNGKRIRHAYIDTQPLIPVSYDQSFIDNHAFIRSTNFQRTIQSAEALLNGLYPIENITGPPHIIDIHTMDYPLEDMHPNPTLCAAAGPLMEDSASQPAFIDLYKQEIIPVFENLNQLLGIDDTSFLTGDCLNTHKCHGYHIPNDAGKYTDLMFNLSVKSHQIQFSYPNSSYTAGKMTLGLFLGTIVDRINGMISGAQSSRKFVLYSGHDSTLAPILIAFQAFRQWPVYASMMAFETYKIPGSYAIRIVYNGEILTLPGCTALCPIDDFRTFMGTLIPSDSECQRNPVLSGAYWKPKLAKCYGKYATDPDVCFGNGKCAADEYCSCNPGWEGTYCKIKVQPDLKRDFFIMILFVVFFLIIGVIIGIGAGAGGMFAFLKARKPDGHQSDKPNGDYLHM